MPGPNPPLEPPPSENSAPAGVRRRPAAAHPLREKVRSGGADGSGAANHPGIYRFLGPRGEVLYVGKSVRVRTRLLSYFQPDARARVREMLRVSRDVEWEYLPNEFEALLGELRQIQAFRPRFNVRHRRERRFAWVKVTCEPAPRLLAVRRPVPDGSRYLGPFPADRSLPRVLRDLARSSGVRDCPARTPLRFADQLDLLRPELAPGCSRAELGSCPAPCAARCTRDEYLRGVRSAVAYLEGREGRLVAKLRERMDAASARLEFEHAGRIRDRIEALERLRLQVTSFRAFLESLTFIYALPGATPELGRGYLVREGRVRLAFPWPDLDSGRPPDSETAARVRTVAAEPPTPPEALPAGGREELFLVARWFRDRPGERERTLPVEEFLSEATAPASSRARRRARTPRPEPAGPKDVRASRAPSSAERGAP